MFKVPSTIAQDLLIIQGLVEEVQPVRVKAQEQLLSGDFDDDASSYNGADSEVEIEADLVLTVEGDGLKAPPPLVSSSDESSDSSDSDSNADENEDNSPLGKSNMEVLDDEDEEVEGPTVTQSSSSYVRTKNETRDPSVTIPDITEVGSEEVLERIGEVMSIFDDVVIVKGLTSQIADRASESALDSDSLLVFEDRKVLGYVYETFGPTYQPLYQVKFTPSFRLDADIVAISRPVFHVPQRSNFVFPSQLKKLKGSDASNVHDEEVAVHEVEFSDDEAEAEFRRKNREVKRQGSRESSVTSSRFSSPSPSRMRDKPVADAWFYGASPYDEHGPYDMDMAPGPSRPPPMPYDDPYREDPTPLTSDSILNGGNQPEGSVYEQTTLRGDDNDGGRARGRMHNRGRGRGKGRGQYNGKNGRQEDTWGRGHDQSRGRSQKRDGGSANGGVHVGRGAHVTAGNQNSTYSPSQYDTHIPRSLSPTSQAIARATGQYDDGATYLSVAQPPSPVQAQTLPGGWAYQQYSTQYCPVQPGYSGQQYQPFVQPHINPRFASLFGIDMNLVSQQYMQQNQYGNSMTASPNGEWNMSSRGTGPSVDEYAVPINNNPEEHNP